MDNKQLRNHLYAAIMELLDKQANWIYVRFYLGITVKEISKMESDDLYRIYKSIKRLPKSLSERSFQTK